MEHSIDILTLFEQKKIRLTSLHKDYKFKSFDCGNTDLNDFLFNDSKIYLKHLRYTTTLIESEDKIVAYYSLANDLLSITDHEDFADEMRDEFQNIDVDFLEIFLNQRVYPAVKIGRLAVDKDFQKLGIGTFLIKSLSYSFVNNNKTGCQFITVDAVSDNQQCAIKFYEKNKFKFLTDRDIGKESRQMYKSLLEYAD